MAFKITVDREKCTGCEACTVVCPDSFEMKDGKSRPKKPRVEKLTCEKEAETECPIQAIKVTKV